MPRQALAPLIAVVGCDGSGKSTVTGLLGRWLAEIRPTSVCHLGKQSGNIGRALARLPGLGPGLERSLHTKAKTAQTEKGPGLLTAIVIYAFTLRRARRFRRMLALRRSGHTIITDRFPQIEIPGAIDGLGLGNAQQTGLIGWLAHSERRKFRAMVAHHPDLVIRLNVSLDVAKARKPDHCAASLARKIGDLSRLNFQNARIVEIDADEPLALVEAKARAAITEFLKSGEGETAAALRAS